MRLQTKILLLLIPLIVLPLLALGWAAYAQQMENARDRTQGQMGTLLDQIQVHTETQLRTARANASLFARSELIARYVQQSPAALGNRILEAEVRDLLFNYQLAYPEYYEIRLVSTDGQERLRSVLGKVRNVTGDESGTRYFHDAASQPGVTFATFFQNADNDQPAMLVSKPLLLSPQGKASGAERELYGYLMITVDLNFLAAYTATPRIGKFGQVFVTDMAGKVLFHPSTAVVGEHIPSDLFFNMKYSVGAHDAVSGSYHGEPANYQGRKLHEQLFVFTVFPERELTSESVLLGRSVALITALAILFTMAFLYTALRTLLVKPIQHLSNAAREIGQGQVLVPIDVRSRDEIGELARTFREMGENLARHHEQVRYVAYHDSLTGLPNRMMFKDYLDRAAAEARRNLQSLAVLFLDLDNFKRINDTLGHQAGDCLLEEFAIRLSGCLRETDVVARTQQSTASEFVARLAGDEFIVLLPREAGAGDAQKVARRILERLGEPFVVEQQELYISTSIGIALFPEDGLTTDALLKNADIAMYHAKKLGRNNYQYYSKEMNDEAVRKLKIESKLRRAVEAGGLELHYQPQMNLSSGRICGVEALLRWNDPELGQVPPDVFIPIAEEYGLIVSISDWVIREACCQAQRWCQLYAEPVTMSINISGVHFNRPELETVIAANLAETGIDPALLELELTETSILQDPDTAASTLDSFKAMGLQISLDDFGTGYSSLSYLMKLPIDKLKIDQSFIRNLDQGADGEAIVVAIIAMAHSLGLKVIAEGIETDSHMDFLRARECDIGQGYQIGRPMRAEAFESLMAELQQRSA